MEDGGERHGEDYFYEVMVLIQDRNIKPDCLEYFGQRSDRITMVRLSAGEGNIRRDRKTANSDY